MPKTKFQELVFTVIMVFVMVYTMTLYNTALEIGLSYDTFRIALLSMGWEAMAAFIVQRYLAGPLVRRRVAQWFRPGTDKPVWIVLATAGCTVTIMAPAMTLFVTFLHHGLTADLLPLWLPKLVLNFPFALCAQVFYVGPLVRFLFRSIFRNQLTLQPVPERGREGAEPW